MLYIKLFIPCVLFFFTLDLLWIGFFSKAAYFTYYGPWLRLEQGQLLPVWWAIFIVYFLFALGTLGFVYPLSQGKPSYAFLYGAALGFIIYGVYDFTCLALFKDWPVTMAFIDWAWGTFLCASCATLTVYLARFI